MSYREIHPSHYIGVAALIAAGVTIFRSLLNTPGIKARRAGAILPPGPKRNFLIGNLLNVPKYRWYDTFSRWQKEYGDIVYVDLITSQMVVINNLEIAEELLDKRASIYSGRGASTIIREVMGERWKLTMFQPGPEFTEQRKILRKVIGPQAVSEYDGVIQSESIRLLEVLSGFSGDPHSPLAQSVGSIIIRISYGEKVYREYGEEMVETNRARVKFTSWAGTRFFMVNVFPILRYVPAWFPGATFRRIGIQASQVSEKVRLLGYSLVKQNIKDGTADESLISQYFHDDDISQDHLRDSVAVLYGAGAETSTISVINFLCILMEYPEIQKKVQAELDENFGDGSALSFGQIQSLRYFNAAWNESMRFNSTSPIGLNHLNTEADIWNGYYIPKGSVIYCNIGFVKRDPRIWGEDANEFKPDRWLPEYNPHAQDLPDMSSLPFGFGRRICPGRHLAERMTLMLAAAILSAYRIVPVDEHAAGQPIEFKDAIIRGPTNFRCKFVPRH